MKKNLIVTLFPLKKTFKTKNRIAFLTLIVFIFSLNHLNAQKSYTQLQELGLIGNVKEVKVYMSNVENAKIPTDTLDYIRKTIMTFDNNGNTLKHIRIFKPNPSIKIVKDYMEFSGSGKDIYYTEIATFVDRTEKLLEKFKYIWKDDYHYEIINIGSNTYVTEINLDKNFLLKKSSFKMGGKMMYDSDYSYVFDNNKILKRIETNVEYVDEKPKETYQIEVVKKFDKNGNPSLVYFYDDKAETNLIAVAFRYYEYY